MEKLRLKTYRRSKRWGAAKVIAVTARKDRLRYKDFTNYDPTSYCNENTKGEEQKVSGRMELMARLYIQVAQGPVWLAFG